MNNKQPSIRRGQIITTFGPGALVNLQIGSFIGMGLEDWPTNNVLYEERLQKRLRMQYFVEPPAEKIYPTGLPYRRFPRWLFCPSCRVLKSYEKWKVDDSRTHIDKPLICSICRYRELVPMSFLVACIKGHIDDFPWVEWIHEKVKDNACVVEYPLEYRKGAGGAGLGSSIIKCTNCGKSRSMQGSFSPNTFDFNCKGSRPWIAGGGQQKCNEKLRTVQRGGSNVYFPRIISSITIPPYSDPLLDKIHKTAGWRAISTAKVTNGTQSLIDGLVEMIAQEVGEPKAKIQKMISSIEAATEKDDSEETYRFAEYEAFQGKYDRSAGVSRDFDVVDGTAGSDYSNFGIKKIFLVKALREVRALVGFTRIQPFDASPEEGVERETDETPRLITLGSTWLPAVEVRGEGIFITFDRGCIEQWAKQESVLRREAFINKNYQRSCERRGIKYRKVSAKKILLHTISHLLIRQLSFECGYSNASLREKIYCDDNESEIKMEGILIYTAAGDADGTLGGLVRQAKPDRLQNILDGMLSNSLWCSNDPLCIESKGQGFESLNLAACYACALLPETSCEEFNKFLDRALIAGLPDDASVSFFKKVIEKEF
jgi:hypothetical protein